MRTPVSRLAVALAAAALLPAASAAAAPPDKQATLSDTTPTYQWTGGPGGGAVYTSTVSAKVPCNPVVFNCDYVLLKTTTLGDLNLTIGSTDQTLKDIDLHLYTSDDQGTQGDLWDESTGSTTDENLGEVDLPAGYWLVKVDYYLGFGSYNGSAQFTPAPPATP